MKKFVFMGLVVASVAIFVGCEGGEDSNSGPYGTSGSSSSSSTSSSSSVVVTSGKIIGSWSLTNNEGHTWYVHFNSDGTYKITDDAAGADNHVYGNYSFSNGSFSGSMNNPGVGTGEIKGTISETSITLNFIEFWHIPHKTVVYNGSKMN
jgi:hypothetical protein